MDEITLCQSCGNEAIARVHSQWLCARCGLHRTNAVAGIGSSGGSSRPGPARSWRGAVRAAIGSGLAAKVLIGAAALAAVGGAVATDAPPVPTPPASTPPSPPVGPPLSPVPGELPEVAADQAVAATTPGVIPGERGSAGILSAGTPAQIPTNVSLYIEAVHDWSACIDARAHEFAEPLLAVGLDPFAACGDRPTPGQFNIGNALGRPDSAGRPDYPGSEDGNPPGKPDDPGSRGSGRS